MKSDNSHLAQTTKKDSTTTRRGKSYTHIPHQWRQYMEVLPRPRPCLAAIQPHVNRGQEACYRQSRVGDSEGHTHLTFPRTVISSPWCTYSDHCPADAIEPLQLPGVIAVYVDDRCAPPDARPAPTQRQPLASTGSDAISTPR